MSGACVPLVQSCSSDDDCENDTQCQCAAGAEADGGACTDGHCVPWGTAGVFDSDCAAPTFLAEAFVAPKVKCQWLDANGQSDVVMLPVVADLDGDHKPEIIFSTLMTNTVIAIHGSTCKEMWRAQVMLTGFESLAVADLDGDGHPEVVVDGAEDLTVLDRTGKVLATAPAVGARFGGPAIANVDGVGPPEIGVGGSVYRYGKGKLTALWSNQYTQPYWGTVSLFADMDGNGTPELVTGLEVFDGATGKNKTPKALSDLGQPGAYPAIADFNLDGKPDIVVLQSIEGGQKLSIVDYAHNKVIFGPYTVAGGGWGGTPTVGDYDGDGVPDIGLASNNFYLVYALKCGRKVKPRDCTGTDDGVLWQRQIHDLSSGGCGSSTFDFNGDGINEVVYRDECWFRVFNGPNGKTVFAMPISSWTALEYPVIADVDNDGHADIIVSSDSHQGNMACAGNPEGQLKQVWNAATQGIFVLSDPNRRWMPSRSLWHQHSYHITEINDDLRVPAHEKDNWSIWNNYRKNVQGEPGHAGALPDFTAGVMTPLDNGGRDCAASERLWANLCNRGAFVAEPGIPGTFYNVDPRLGPAVPLCTAHTVGELLPGMCEAVYCDRASPPPDPEDLWFRADDDGQSTGVTAECKQNNDLLFLPQYVCHGIG